MQRARTENKGKARQQKPYQRVILPSAIQGRLSQYITAGNPPEPETSTRSGGERKARRPHDVQVKVEPEESITVPDDDAQSNHTNNDISEHEVAHELEQSRHYAHTAISSDSGSDEWDQLVSEIEGKNNSSGIGGSTSGRRGDRRKRDVQRSAQAFASPLAKHSKHSPRKEVSQPDGRPTVEELDKFADEMNDLIDSFCKHAKSQVHKFVNRRRQLILE